ncbi:MAG: flagellar protein FlgN [Methylococcales bacterium]
MNGNSQPLLELLETILQHTEGLLSLLERENQILVNRQPEYLEELAKEKLRIVTELNRLTKLQDEFLQSNNLPAGKRGLQAWTDGIELPKTEKNNLLSLWDKVRQTTEQCQTMNETNAITIERLALHVNRSLDILRGVTNRANSIYGPNGHQTGQAESKSLASV